VHRLAHSTAALSPSSPARSGANACMCDVAHGRLQSCCGSHINQLVDDVFSLLDVDKSGFATEKAMCDFLCEQLAADESYAGAVSPARGRLPAPALASPSPGQPQPWPAPALASPSPGQPQPLASGLVGLCVPAPAHLHVVPFRRSSPLCCNGSVSCTARRTRINGGQQCAICGSGRSVGKHAASAASSKNGWIPSEAMDVKSVTMLFREVRLPACYHSCIHDRAHSQKYRHVSYVLIRPT
jgi:hypothetical protein